MKRRKVKYSDERMGKIKIVEDFLPKPQDFVLKGEIAKNTYFGKTKAIEKS